MLATCSARKNHCTVLALGFGSMAPVHSGAAFEAWLVAAGVPPEARPGLALRFADFRRLHGAVVDAFGAAATGQALPTDAVARLNETAALVPFAPRLRVDGGRAVLVDEPEPTGRAADVLSAIARSAIRLLGSADADRLRRCPRCATFFLASRPDRVWCGASCGNRERVARHHARRRISA
ncbi:MAG: ABATE domain-containing protein [Actinomycetota bacterium]